VQNIIYKTGKKHKFNWEKNWKNWRRSNKEIKHGILVDKKNKTKKNAPIYI